MNSATTVTTTPAYSSNMLTDMNKEEFIERIIKKSYDRVCVMSVKPEKEIVRFRHRQLHRDIVVKLFNEDVPACRFLSGIIHENLPEIYDVYDLDDGFAEIEEYVSGMNVGEMLEAGLFKYKTAGEVMRQLCAALSVLHENGFVHRDIKPENVIISDKGPVKLIDFDACRRFSRSKYADTHILGTVGYAPPEQYGITQSDGRSDIYAAGVLFNVMLTGAHPSDKLAPGRAGRIITKCTQINPEQRYQSAEQLANAL